MPHPCPACRRLEAHRPAGTPCWRPAPHRQRPPAEASEFVGVWGCCCSCRRPYCRSLHPCPSRHYPLPLACLCSTLGSIAHALGRDSMYAADTGFCNEEVPLNEHGERHSAGWGLNRPNKQLGLGACSMHLAPLPLHTPTTALLCFPCRLLCAALAGVRWAGLPGHLPPHGGCTSNLNSSHSGMHTSACRRLQFLLVILEHLPASQTATALPSPTAAPHHPHIICASHHTVGHSDGAPGLPQCCLAHMRRACKHQLVARCG